MDMCPIDNDNDKWVLRSNDTLTIINIFTLLVSTTELLHFHLKINIEMIVIQ